ncbi:MAG: hypothetical protein ACKV2Q_04880 [Planctomycetaceae bacterium]
MIQNDNELQAMWQRMNWFQNQIALIREKETNPHNYHASVSGFVAELERMQIEVREYLSVHPSEIEHAAVS